MKKFSVVIIDDESPARELIRNFLKPFEEFEVVGEAENGFDGCRMINEIKPDLVFLDVQMPKLTGLEVIDLLEKPIPFIIFSTAYDQYAVKAFEKNAVDYLLKPYSRERFRKSLERFKNSSKETILQIDPLLENLHAHEEKIRRIPVRSGSRIHVLKPDEIKFIEAQDDYIKLFSTKGTFLKQQTMKYMDNHLPEETFVRIHRSYILNINFLSQLEIYDRSGYTAVLTDGQKLPVSRSGNTRLKKIIQLD